MLNINASQQAARSSVEMNARSREQYHKILEEKLLSLETKIRMYQQQMHEPSIKQNSTIIHQHPTTIPSYHQNVNQPIQLYQYQHLNTCVTTLKQKQEENNLAKQNQLKMKDKNTKNKHLRINVMKLKDKHHFIDKNIFNITIGEIMEREQPFSKKRLMREISYLKDKIVKMEESSKQPLMQPLKQNQKQSNQIINKQYSTINPETSRDNRSSNCGKIVKRSSFSTTNRKNAISKSKEMIDESTFYRWYPKINYHEQKQSNDNEKSKTLRNYQVNPSHQVDYQSTTRRRNIRTAADKKNRYIQIEDQQEFDGVNQNNSQFQEVMEAPKSSVIVTSQPNSVEKTFFHPNQDLQQKSQMNSYQIQASNIDENDANQIKQQQIQTFKQKVLRQYEIIERSFTLNFKEKVIQKLKIPQNFPLAAPSNFNSIEDNEHLVERLYKQFDFLKEISDCRTKPIIRKYNNCISFELSKEVTVNWYYNNVLYIGGWKTSITNQGVKDGSAFQFIPGKYVYRGTFLDGKRSGYGIIKTIKYSTQNINDHSGMMYEGDWLQDKPHGYGRELLENGDQYIGQFKNGQKTGQSKIFLKSGEIYEGEVIAGVKTGEGYERLLNGDEYFGEYEAGKFHGEGRYKWMNGSIYQGTFVYGIRTGRGIYKSSNGDKYEGQYVNNLKEGYGIYQFRNGQQYKGFFQNDVKHGEGYYIYPHGKIAKYVWKDGKILKKIYSKEEELYRQRNRRKESVN